MENGKLIGMMYWGAMSDLGQILPLPWMPRMAALSTTRSLQLSSAYDRTWPIFASCTAASSCAAAGFRLTAKTDPKATFAYLAA